MKVINEASVSLLYSTLMGRRNVLPPEVTNLQVQLQISLLGGEDSVDKIRGALYRVLNFIDANSLIDPRIIADILYAPSIIYPMNGLLASLDVLRILPEEKLLVIGEGVVIGLLNILNSFYTEGAKDAERIIIDASLTRNEHVIRSMCSSRSTSAGSGGLTNEISRFVGQHVWLEDWTPKRKLIFAMLRKLREHIATLEKRGGSDRETVIEKFAHELMTRMLVNCPIESKFELFELMDKSYVPKR